MNKCLIPLFLALIICSCHREEIPAPTTQVDCQLDFSAHPKQEKYQAVLNSFTGSPFVGLTVLVDHPQDDLWIGSTGWADLENELPMTPCHLQHAASIIKTYIAVVILQLESEGKINLDDQLQSYLPGDLLDQIPNGQEFTIRQLLQCRSGMPDTFESEFLLDFLNRPTQQYSMEELIAFLYGVKPVGTPGERFYYGDGNFILLSMLIESLEGSLQEVFQRRIFDPLGCQDSYLINSPSQLPAGVAASYWDRHGNGVVENVSTYQVALTAGLEGTDGLISTVYDLNLFQRGLVNGTLLNTNSYSQLVDFVDIKEGESSINYQAYGLGIARVQLSEHSWYGSFGNHVGSSAFMLYNPEQDVSIVATQNNGTFFNDDMKVEFFAFLILALEACLF